MPALSTTSTLQALLYANNANNSIKVGPVTSPAAFTGFHNHIGFLLVAMARLGAPADSLQPAYETASANMLRPVPSRGLINSSNWEHYIGMW